jgi:tRNA(Arg) A34 adenosine deaminase TadA
VRALAFARVDGAIESAVEEARIGDAAGLVLFGDVLVRQAGAVLSADRRKSLQWIAAGDCAEIAASGSAKRVLWSELRRVLRALRAGR